MHLYMIRDHTKKRIVLVAENMKDAKAFVVGKIVERKDKIGWKIDENEDIVFYSNNVQGIVYSITGFDTGVEYEDL